MTVPPGRNSYVHVPFSDHHVYHVNINGHVFCIIVTASASAAENWVREVRNENAAALASNTVICVGINVMQAATLQLSVGNRSLVFQLVQAETVPRSLRAFLLEPACRFFTYGNENHRGILRWSHHAVLLGSDIYEIRSFLAEQYADCTLHDLAKAYLGYDGVNRTAEATQSDWGAENLTRQQVFQASIEARCACLIGQLFVDNNPGKFY